MPQMTDVRIFLTHFSTNLKDKMCIYILGIVNEKIRCDFSKSELYKLPGNKTSLSENLRHKSPWLKSLVSP